MKDAELREFLDTLSTGQDIDIVLHGRHYHIQGYYTDIGTDQQVAHVEMDDYDQTVDDRFVVWEGEGTSVALVTAKLLRAKVWDGTDFESALDDIKWV